MTLKELAISFCLTYGCQGEVPKIPSVTSYDTLNSKYLKLIEEIAKNPSREAALTKQESAWNPVARSPYAKGLRQFTGKTGKWAAKGICRHLGSYRPYDAMWSLRCGVIYAEWLEDNNPRFVKNKGYCFNRAVAEQRYNGGGYVLRELLRSDTLNLSDARTKCRRASWACRENYSYPIKIDKNQVQYKDLGGTICLKGKGVKDG